LVGGILFASALEMKEFFWFLWFLALWDVSTVFWRRHVLQDFRLFRFDVMKKRHQAGNILNFSLWGPLHFF
jgi:hypothetical protein